MNLCFVTYKTDYNGCGELYVSDFKTAQAVGDCAFGGAVQIDCSIGKRFVSLAVNDLAGQKILAPHKGGEDYQYHEQQFPHLQSVILFE